MMLGPVLIADTTLPLPCPSVLNREEHCLVAPKPPITMSGHLIRNGKQIHDEQIDDNYKKFSRRNKLDIKNIF